MQKEEYFSTIELESQIDFDLYFEKPHLVGKLAAPRNNYKFSDEDYYNLKVLSQYYSSDYETLAHIYLVVVFNHFQTPSFDQSFKAFKLFYSASKINHSCNPNCIIENDKSFAGKEMPIDKLHKIGVKMTALRDIKKDEEILIRYSLCDSLEQEHGFKCECNH